jgi:hypothetical protein
MVAGFFLAFLPSNVNLYNNYCCFLVQHKMSNSYTPLKPQDRPAQHDANSKSGAIEQFKVTRVLMLFYRATP